MQANVLIEKIKILPSQQQAEVEDFVDFIIQKEERKLVASATKLSERAFEKVWDNDEDAIYDEL